MKVSKEDSKVFQDVKKASGYAREKKFNAAIKILDRIIMRLRRYELDHSSVCIKVIPYFQKAGRYEELESYALKTILPALERRAELTFRHKPKLMQSVFYSLQVSRVYDKLRLAAQRERRQSDFERFNQLSKQYWDSYETLLPKAEADAKSAEFIEMQEMFGNDYSTWPEPIRNRFDL